MESWPIERVKFSRKPSRPARKVALDLKPLIESITVDNAALSWTGKPLGGRWAKPAEVLRLVGLDPAEHLSQVVRTAVECDL